MVADAQGAADTGARPGAPGEDTEVGSASLPEGGPLPLAGALAEWLSTFWGCRELSSHAPPRRRPLPGVTRGSGRPPRAAGSPGSCLLCALPARLCEISRGGDDAMSAESSAEETQTDG